MEKNYCEWHWLSGQNCEDGPEVEIIDNERKNRMAEFLEFITRTFHGR